MFDRSKQLTDAEAHLCARIAPRIRPNKSTSRLSLSTINFARSPPLYQLFSSTRLFVGSLFNSCCRGLQGFLMSARNSQTGRAHLLLISHTPGIPGGAMGVITLEGQLTFFLNFNASQPIFAIPWLDIIEEIISEEIVDETDRYEDNQSKKRAKRMTTAAVMRGSVTFLLRMLRVNCRLISAHASVSLNASVKQV